MKAICLGSTTIAGRWELRDHRVLLSCPVCGAISVHQLAKVSGEGVLSAGSCESQTCDVVGPFTLNEWKEIVR